MSPTATCIPTLIAAGQSIRVEDGTGTSIRALDGTIWITQEGDVRDVVLRAGQSFTLDRGGLALLVALETSAVARIEAPQYAAAAALIRSLRPARDPRSSSPVDRCSTQAA